MRRILVVDQHISGQDQNQKNTYLVNEEAQDKEHPLYYFNSGQWIEAPEIISLYFSINGDCGQSSYTRPPIFTYWVAPGDGVVFLTNPPQHRLLGFKMVMSSEVHRV